MGRGAALVANRVARRPRPRAVIELPRSTHYLI